MRPSKRSRWRAASLIAVHGIVAAHIVHWKLAGRTLTPVEPSEAMQTLGEGLVNAGFVLFAILILSTLIFGRFFCGWACHIVALQDLCTWLLRKLGLRPRPFRSRLLIYVPLLAAIWMFVMPSLVRLSMGTQHPMYRAGFFTDDLWERFPGPWVAGLTFLVCGFLIVYLLGNKGFCTYACPYGGVFGLADTVAPGKIRVSDACDGCGHCTATCTSNVRVHEEVKLYRMVVNPGCMKCMDCIDVCPKGALSFGFGAPSVAKGKPRAVVAPRPFDFTPREELAMAAIFLVSIAILRALYDAVPFLLALGLASISAFTLLTAARTLYSPNLHYSRYQLRANGRTTTAGCVFLSLATLWTLFLAHSAVVQYDTLAGARLVERASSAASAPDASAGPDRRAMLERGRALLERGARRGLFASGPLEARIAAASQSLGDAAGAERHYRRAVEISDDLAAAHLELARYARTKGATKEAIRELEAVVRLEPDLDGADGELADLLLQEGRGAEALKQMEDLMERRPGLAAFRLTHALVLAQTGQVERGLKETEDVTRSEPHNANAHHQLGRMLASQQRLDEALVALARAAELAPTSIDAHLWTARVATALSRWTVAKAHLETAMRQTPFDATLTGVWAGVLQRSGELESAIASAERKPASDRVSRFQRIYLYRAAGRTQEAATLAAESPPAP